MYVIYIKFFLQKKSQSRAWKTSLSAGVGSVYPRLMSVLWEQVMRENREVAWTIHIYSIAVS